MGRDSTVIFLREAMGGEEGCAERPWAETALYTGANRGSRGIEVREEASLWG